MTTLLLSDIGSRELELAVALQRSEHAAVLRGSPHGAGAGSGCCAPGMPAGSSSRIFRGTGEQVRAVRAFARSVLAGHPACDDAVLVASELASNAVAHSASGTQGGLFAVRVARVTGTHAAVLVTDQGAAGDPCVRAADDDAESGRGLAVVRALSSSLTITGDEGGMCSVLAVVPVSPGDPVTASDNARAAPAREACNSRNEPEGNIRND